MPQLFSEKKNLYFHLLMRLLSSDQRSFTRAQMDMVFSDSGFVEYNYDFVSSLIGTDNNSFEKIALFHGHKEQYQYRLPDKPAVRLSLTEKRWLADMLSDDLITTVLPEQIARKLAGVIGAPTPSFPMPKTEVLLACIHAMLNNEALLCNNTTAKGILFEKELLLPYKLEYSLRSDGFWIIGYLLQKGKMVKMAVARMQVLQTISNEYQIDLENLLEDQRAPEPIKFEIKDENGALERALFALSAYNREGAYDSLRDIYTITVHYYTFDEHELVQDIIALGSHVHILRPSSVRQEITKRIRQQLKLLKTSK